jgi:uncharacterized membrane protein YdbT with pleckstrin-like domain
MALPKPNIQTSEIIQFIRKSHLFRGLSEEELQLAASFLQVMPYPAGRILVKQGSTGSKFYMVFSGGLRVTTNRKGEPEKQTMFHEADHIGEELLFDENTYSLTASTLEESVFLVLNRQNASELFSQIDPVKANFEAARDNQYLINKIHFKWLPPGEVLYFLARKHPILLWKSLIPPLLLLIGPIYLFFYYGSTENKIAIVLAFLLLGVSILWVILARINWANDYYVVTNKRVIWLEKVIGFYDSRQEAPLETILSVGVETNIIGRWLDYGDVIVRTFVGQIKFYHVHRPNHAASLVEEHWVRSRDRVRKNDNEAMQEIMHKKMGLTEENSPVEEESESSVKSTVKPGWIQVWFSDIFKTRLEENGTITYRKHWLVLFRSTWIPGMLGIMLIAMLLYQVIYVPLSGSEGIVPPINLNTLVFGMVAILVSVFGWWLYNYMDWRNDIYQVTQDQVFDIKKRPLGREEHQVAPLDNILSTEYKRIGLMQVVFNYGNVYITVGGSELVFENVADPVTVQKDIDMVRMAMVARKTESENKAERDRLADWFTVYHNDPLTNPGKYNSGEQSLSDEHDVQ